MASLSRGGEKRAAARSEAEHSISVEAELLALKRKAEAWGADENCESITSFAGRHSICRRHAFKSEECAGPMLFLYAAEVHVLCVRFSVALHP